MQRSKVALAALTAFALAAGIGTASAQRTKTTTTTTTISPEQETTIYRAITRDQVAVQPPPPEWTPSVGTEVPAQVQLYDMPTTLDMPSVQGDRYTVVNRHIVLVDPGTRRVVRIIER